MRKFVVLFLSIVFCVACSHKTNRLIIPEEKFKDVLMDIHLVDGYYMMNFNKYLNVKDSNSFYTQILKKNGVTRAEFDSSMVYYSKDPKRFEEIYDEVLTEFNRMSQELYIIRSLTLDSVHNLYKGKKNIHIDGKGFAEKIPFEFAINDTGLYEITVQLQVFKDDHSKNLKLTAYSTCKGCADKSKFQYFEPVSYKKTTKLRVFKISKRIKDKSQKVIRGYILNQDDQKVFQRHIYVKWIFANKIFNEPKAQTPELFQDKKRGPRNIK